MQNGDIWTTHFKTLYNTVQIDTNAEQRQIHEVEWIRTSYKGQSKSTDQELYKKRQALKCKNACGPDGILNDLNWQYKNCFNLILSVGYFPDIWNQGLITSIFNNGDKFDANN